MKTTIAIVNAATAAVLLTLGGAATAQAGPGSLQGRYGVSASGTCLGSPTGFYPNNVAIEPSSVGSNVAHGVFTFERDGTGSASIVQTQLNLPPLSESAPWAFSSSADITFNFTYELAPGGAMTVNLLLDTYAAKYLTGPLAAAGFGATFVTTGLAKTWVLSGTYSNDRKTLLLNSGDTVSKSRLSNGSYVSDTYVICQIGRVLTRLTP